MTRLDQIGVTVVVGFIVQTTAIVLFGFAQKARSTHTAPRCEARPRNVIYNPNPTDPSQDRGNAWVGWVFWVLKLSYDDMISGVPGTGTRDGGLSGSLLRVNMDNVVMLRFHSYGLRIATVGLVLYIGIILPLYWSAGCSGDETGTLADFCGNMTDYDYTTLSNIIIDEEPGEALVGLSGRLYAVVFCSWIVTAYACSELKQEWIDILAMRRHYFLEKDHWKGQANDLQRIENASQHGTSLPATRQTVAKSSRRVHLPWRKRKAEEPDHLKNRDPWIPHPEMRDTPPAVALYSVLVGGIPSKPPGQLGNEEDIELADEQNSNREWQLNVTSAFFDHCIPNQPGFSSSVAAVTMLPNAQELASAWSRWYAAAKKLRRLRFIRSQIRAKRNLDIGLECVEEGGIAEGATGSLSMEDKNTIHSSSSQSSSMPIGTDTTPEDYKREVLGSTSDEDVEEIFLEALDFGPEQTAVYSREYAQSSAACCPYGCFEGKITNASIEDLIDMEESALDEVHAANKALEKARLHALTSKQPKKTPVKPSSKKHKRYTSNSASKTEKTATQGRSHRKIPLMGTAELPIDFGTVKNILGNETMRNLMGKDSGGVSSEYKKGHRKVQSLEKVHFPSNFDLELQLYNHSNQKQQASSRGLPPTTGRGRCWSEAIPSSPPNTFPDNTKTLNTSLPVLPVNETGQQDKNINLTVRSSTVEDVRDSDSAQILDDDSYASLFEEDYSLNQPESQLRHPGEPLDMKKMSLQDFDEDIETSARDVPDRRALLRKDNAIYNASTVWDLVDLGAEDPQETMLSTGSWQLSSITDIFAMLYTGVRKLLRWTSEKSNAAVDLVASQGTYAIVTFTSRQAAVAARQVLADGRGSYRFNQIAALPIPPLADAAPGDVFAFHSCCRPVTMSINDGQKKSRNYFSLFLLCNIYFFYTIPLTSAAAYANSENLSSLFPGLRAFKDGFLTADLLSALVGALIWALFFAIAPLMFKTIANFGSNATSSVAAEFWALKAFWWFMVVSAFSGTSLQTLILEGFNEGIRVGDELESILRTIATTIPSQVSATWINWIIVKTSVTGPLMYLLQLNTFIFDWAKLKCCVRAARGSGPGAPLPFRIYVDSGVVLLCLHALAPASPLVAVFVFFYFLFSTPMLRRNVIFMYRPKFDAGGIRWPFLFDMSISSMFVGQILLATMMALKESLGPALLAAAPFIPTYLFRDAMRHKYLRAFNDVGLLQTSLLDGWDTANPESVETREARRKFLVDAHKAAYVPVCIAGTSADDKLTAEPAVVIPTLSETELSPGGQANHIVTPRAHNGAPHMQEQGNSFRNTSQFGATLRRAPTLISPSAANGFNSTFETQKQR